MKHEYDVSNVVGCFQLWKFSFMKEIKVTYILCIFWASCAKFQWKRNWEECFNYFALYWSNECITLRKYVCESFFSLGRKPRLLLLFQVYLFPPRGIPSGFHSPNVWVILFVCLYMVLARRKLNVSLVVIGQLVGGHCGRTCWYSVKTTSCTGIRGKDEWIVFLSDFDFFKLF